jgi:cell division septation protein DedD
MIRFATVVILALAVVTLPAVASGKFIRTNDYESIQLGPDRAPKPSPRHNVTSPAPPSVPLTSPAPVQTNPAVGASPAPPSAPAPPPAPSPVPRRRGHLPSAASPVPLVTQAPSTPSTQTPAAVPNGPSAVRATATVTQPVIEDGGSVGPSQALLIGAITALGAAAVLVLRARPRWFGGHEPTRAP